MRSKVIFAGVSIVAPAAALLVACQDTFKAPTASNEARTRITATASATRARVHKQNPHEWVGVAHNKALDDWRKEMRKPGVLTHNLCSYATDFATRDERFPDGKHVHSPLPSRRKAVGAAIKDSKLCQAMIAKSSFPPSLVSRGKLRQGTEALAAMEAQIDEAVEAAESSYDLATRLAPVMEATASLSEAERTVILATISVTLNSYEYWEGNFAAVVDEITNEYGPCATDRLAAGYGTDAAREACLSGEAFDVTFRGWSPSAMFGPTSRPTGTALSCGPTLREGFRHVAKGDSKGAITGALGAMITGPAGIVTAALVGGSVASVWAAGENAWSTFWCIMAK